MLLPLLRHDLYYDDESNDDSDDESDDEKVDADSDTESDMNNDDTFSDKSDDEDQMPPHKRKTKIKKMHIRKEPKLMSKDVEPKSPEAKPEPSKPESDPAFKSNMDDLTDRISRLTIKHLTKQQARPRSIPQATSSEMWHCFMCNRNGHGFRDCPEMKVFLAAGVL